MSIEEQLATILDDPEKIAMILKLTEPKLTAQQRYMQPEKGKASKAKSNAKYGAKPKPPHDSVVLQYLASHIPAQRQNLSLTELWEACRGWAAQQKLPSVKRDTMKNQLATLQIPFQTSYLVENKRVHPKTYRLDPEQLREKLA